MNFLKKQFLLILLLFVSISNSQERIVTGHITTFKKIALVKAEVKVLSSKIVVLTDTTGYFKVLCSPKDKIKISAKGFFSQKVNLDEKTNEVTVDLKLKPNEKSIDQAIGYGHINEKDKSLPITTIKNENNSKFNNYTNIIDFIIDTSPSVSVMNGQIVIRGEGSLNGSSAALILLDGSQINMTQLSAIDPLQVKSVDILKGGSASIYGVRGANGVVLLTTKK